MNEPNDAPPVLVPPEHLSPAALRGVIEEFVTREGTDYGVEVSLDDKVAEVRAAIDRGDVVIVFDPRAESVNLVRREDLRETETHTRIDRDDA